MPTSLVSQGVQYPNGSIRTSGKWATRAIFGYGSGASSATNLVNNYGRVATDTTGVGTARFYLAAAGYGGDKAIFGYGSTGSDVSMTNLVSNLGVVSTDVTGVGTSRYLLAAAGYGGDKAIFGYGYDTGVDAVGMTNLVSNTGVVGSDVTGVGTSRWGPAAAGYGGDKAIFGYGYSGSAYVALTNLVSNTGVVGNDVSGVGTSRSVLAAAGYGGDKAIFAYGEATPSGDSNYVNTINLVSNTGVVSSDATGVGTSRAYLAAAGYGGDKAIFGYGQNYNPISEGYPSFNITNLVSNLGVVSSDVTGVGTARYGLAAASYSS